MTGTKRKTKAQIEAELAEALERLAELEGTEPVKQTWLETWGPALVAVVGVVLVLGWQNIKVDTAPTPGPGPDKPSIERTVSEVLPAISKGYSETFATAADKVASGEIKTDKALLEFVQPALVELRKEKQRPFDEMFHLSLPRGDDGSFGGKEAEVEQFLRRIAKSW
jgi:hypothetical protein